MKEYIFHHYTTSKDTGLVVILKTSQQFKTYNQAVLHAVGMLEGADSCNILYKGMDTELLILLVGRP